MQKRAKAGRPARYNEERINIHLQLSKEDVHFLDSILVDRLRRGGDPRWAGNIFRPDLIRYLIEFYIKRQP